MSTKIFNAYRTKSRRQADNWQLLWDIQATARKNVQAVLSDFILDICKGEGDWERTKKDLQSKKDQYDFDQDITRRPFWVERWLGQQYKKQLGQFERDLFNFDVVITVRPKQGRFYLIGYCDMLMRHTLDFLANDERLEYYGYWNNTDKPDETSTREWNKRGKVWREFDKHWENQLTLDICTWESYTNGVFGLSLMDDMRGKWKAHVDSLTKNP